MSSEQKSASSAGAGKPLLEVLQASPSLLPSTSAQTYYTPGSNRPISLLMPTPVPQYASPRRPFTEDALDMIYGNNRGNLVPMSFFMGVRSEPQQGIIRAKKGYSGAVRGGTKFLVGEGNKPEIVTRVKLIGNGLGVQNLLGGGRKVKRRKTQTQPQDPFNAMTKLAFG